MLLFSAVTLREDTRTVAQTQDVQVIWMTAKKYEFSPSRVHVKSGMKVQVKITALDRDHGFKIAVTGDGADSSALAGLEFTSSQGNDGWKLKKGKETTIELVAKTARTYEFQCSVACGIHHGRMKGELVVDP
jgi:heme/copper-type cytochrome/quinol oxidase subunit 2